MCKPHLGVSTLNRVPAMRSFPSTSATDRPAVPRISRRSESDPWHGQHNQNAGGPPPEGRTLGPRAAVSWQGQVDGRRTWTGRFGGGPGGGRAAGRHVRVTVQAISSTERLAGAQPVTDIVNGQPNGTVIPTPDKTTGLYGPGSQFDHSTTLAGGIFQHRFGGAAGVYAGDIFVLRVVEIPSLPILRQETFARMKHSHLDT